MPEQTTDRLRFAYHLSRGLTSIADLEDLVKFATQRARELFEAEGSALIMLDRERHELFFPVVSDVDRFAQMRVGRLRFPADHGVAGWVIKNDQATIVEDTAGDPRFYSGIDQRSKMKTQAMLCAPLRTARGTIGVIEIINPEQRFLTATDLQFLESVASDVALAYERAQLATGLRGEIGRLRQALRLAAAGALVTGAGLLGAVISGATVAPVAAALGVVALAGAVALFGVARGWWGS